MISPGLPGILPISITSSAATRYCLPPVLMTANIVLVLVFEFRCSDCPDRLLPVGLGLGGAGRPKTLAPQQKRKRAKARLAIAHAYGGCACPCQETRTIRHLRGFAVCVSLAGKRGRTPAISGGNPCDMCAWH